MSETTTNEMAYERVVQVVANAYRSGVHDEQCEDAIRDDETLLAWAADLLESAGILPGTADV